MEFSQFNKPKAQQQGKLTEACKANKKGIQTSHMIDQHQRGGGKSQFKKVDT